MFLDEKITSQWLSYGVLSAVSGGADSITLLHLLARFQAEQKLKLAPELKSIADILAVAHINHGLRGEESDADADFVRKIADRYGLRYFEHRITHEEWDADQTGSREAAARQIRYDFFIRTAERLGFRYVAVAHTADDQTETVIHRIFRGTGISGLTGIVPFRQLNPAVTLIRPLLDVRRRDILDYLNQIGETFRTDSTNLENDMTRNRIRNQLLPALRQDFNPKVDDAVVRLAKLAAENEEILNELIENLFDNAILRQTSDEILLNSLVLRNCSAAVLRKFFVRLWKRKGWSLREMGFDQWARLVDFFLTQTETGHCELRSQTVAEHHSGQFLIRKMTPTGIEPVPRP